MKPFKNHCIILVSLLFLSILVFQSSSATAWYNPIKKIKDKIEVTGGWDRYIYAWGERFVPPSNRWIAIRSAMKKGSHDMGNFWDVPGGGREVEGNNKELILWGLDRKFQSSPDKDRRYRFIPAWEVASKNKSDFGYYYILCSTNYFVTYGERRKGSQLRLLHGFQERSKNYPDQNRYKWKVENVGKNRFIIINKDTGYVIDAFGGNGSKPGTKLAQWSRNNRDGQKWEFIYIAQGNEIKSTRKMARSRSKEIARATKSFVTGPFNNIKNVLKKEILKGVKSSTNSLSKGLIEVKQDKRKKILILRVGVDNPLDKLQELKDKTVSRFVEIDLKRFKFEIVNGTIIKLSLINSIAAMGQHVDLTLSFIGNWKLTKSGFNISNLKMDRFSIPFFPDSTTSGIRNAVSNSLRNTRINIKNYPGHKLVAKVLRKARKSNLNVQNIQKSRSKFLVNLSY